MVDALVRARAPATARYTTKVRLGRGRRGGPGREPTTEPESKSSSWAASRTTAPAPAPAPAPAADAEPAPAKAFAPPPRGSSTGSSAGTYSLEQLTDKRTWEKLDITATERETYLPEPVFIGLFGMSKADFAALPKWKKDTVKKKHDLF